MTTYVSPTGEELYLMVTSRFKNGSFSWHLVDTPEAWNLAAADLLLSPDTLLARYRQPLFERIDAALIKSGMQRTFKCCDVNHIKFCSTDTYKGNLEAFARALLNEPMESL